MQNTDLQLLKILATQYPQVNSFRFTESGRSWSEFLETHEINFDRTALLYWLSLETEKEIIVGPAFVPIRGLPMRLDRNNKPEPRTPYEWSVKKFTAWTREEIPQEMERYPQPTEIVYDRSRRLTKGRAPGAYVRRFTENIVKTMDWQIERRWVIDIMFRGSKGRLPHTKTLMQGKDKGRVVPLPKVWNSMEGALKFLSRAEKNAESRYGLQKRGLPPYTIKIMAPTINPKREEDPTFNTNVG